VIVVTHGEFMWAARAELEYLTDEQWVLADRDAAQKIHNTQVIQYSRVDPESGAPEKYLSWQKSVCPWKDEAAKDWNPISRRKFSNSELLEQVEEIKPLVNSE